jgi:hypothetical protein
LDICDIELSWLDWQAVRLQFGGGGNSFGKITRAQYDADPLLCQLSAKLETDTTVASSHECDSLLGHFGIAVKEG